VALASDASLLSCDRYRLGDNVPLPMTDWQKEMAQLTIAG
jgi:hypothetical protein